MNRKEDMPRNASVLVGAFSRLQSKRYFNNLANIVSQMQEHDREFQKLKTELESMDKRMPIVLRLAGTMALKRADIAMDILNGDYRNVDNGLDEVELLNIMILAGLNYMNL